MTVHVYYEVVWDISMSNRSAMRFWLLVVVEIAMVMSIERIVSRLLFFTEAKGNRQGCQHP